MKLRPTRTHFRTTSSDYSAAADFRSLVRLGHAGVTLIIRAAELATGITLTVRTALPPDVRRGSAPPSVVTKKKRAMPLVRALPCLGRRPDQGLSPKFFV